jgi:protein-L-isoaspartate(D-aspartate) O-methyltransferase
MTEILLSSGPLNRVLEIGTGSGYQATILSQLVSEIHTVERIEPLLIKAKEKFRRLRLTNIEASLSDGSFGWEKKAPYNGIITTAAPQSIPKGLLEQLAPDGILVIPIGGTDSQDLTIVRRIGDSFEFDQEIIEKVKFVPLLGGLSRQFL